MTGGMAELKQAGNNGFALMLWCLVMGKGDDQCAANGAMLGFFSRLDRIAIGINGDGFDAAAGANDDRLGLYKSQTNEASRNLWDQKSHQKAED